MTQEEKDELDRRSRDDFEFLVVAHAVGDPAIYSLFRDRGLDELRNPKQQELPLERDDYAA